MSNAYRVIANKELLVKELKPHPLAKLPTAAEDFERLEEDIAAKGQLDPLIVNEQMQILDGVTRWTIAKKLGKEKIDCTIVADADPRDVIISKGTTGRRQTTGGRVLITLLTHAEEVLLAADIADELRQRPDLTADGVIRILIAKGEKISESKARRAWEEWSVSAIAERLRVNSKDVKLAVSLLRAQREKKMPSDLLAAQGRDEKEVHDVVTQIFDRVLTGDTPIRRWKAAVGGKLPTIEGRGKAETNHGDLCRRAMVSLITTFTNWKKVKPLAFSELEKKWEEVLANVPEHLEDLMMREVERRKERR